jgi:hypothetical protein
MRCVHRITGYRRSRGKIHLGTLWSHDTLHVEPAAGGIIATLIGHGMHGNAEHDDSACATRGARDSDLAHYGPHWLAVGDLVCVL